MEDLSDLPVQADFDVTYASGVNGISYTFRLGCSMKANLRRAPPGAQSIRMDEPI